MALEFRFSTLDGTNQVIEFKSLDCTVQSVEHWTVDTSTTTATPGPGQYVGSHLARTEYLPGPPVLSTSVVSVRHTRVIVRFPEGEVGHADVAWDIPLLDGERAKLVFAEVVEGTRVGEKCWLGIRELCQPFSYYFWQEQWVTARKVQRKYLTDWLYFLGYQPPANFINIKHKGLRLHRALRADGTKAQWNVAIEAGIAAVEAMETLFF